MKVSKLVNNLKDAYRIRQIQKQEQNIVRHVKIHDIDTYGTSYSQLYEARGTLANYAMKNGVSIDIYDAQKKVNSPDVALVRIRNNMYDKLDVVVTNLLTGRKTQRFVSANTDGNTMNHKYEVTVISGPNPDDTIIAHTGKVHEDSFLRNFYRNVEDMTNTVLGKKNR